MPSSTLFTMTECLRLLMNSHILSYVEILVFWRGDFSKTLGKLQVIMEQCEMMVPRGLLIFTLGYCKL